MGPSILVELKKFFQERKILEALNHTHITLIPKVQGLESIGNYKPIGLCNTLNKMVTKIIVERIRPLLENVISLLQTTFVPSKKGIDNVIIMQELVHTLSKKKRQSQVYGN